MLSIAELKTDALALACCRYAFKQWVEPSLGDAVNKKFTTTCLTVEQRFGLKVDPKHLKLRKVQLSSIVCVAAAQFTSLGRLCFI